MACLPLNLQPAALLQSHLLQSVIHVDRCPVGVSESSCVHCVSSLCQAPESFLRIFGIGLVACTVLSNNASGTCKQTDRNGYLTGKGDSLFSLGQPEIYSKSQTGGFSLGADICRFERYKPMQNWQDLKSSMSVIYSIQRTLKCFEYSFQETSAITTTV